MILIMSYMTNYVRGALHGLHHKSLSHGVDFELINTCIELIFFFILIGYEHHILIQSINVHEIDTTEILLLF